MNKELIKEYAKIEWPNNESMREYVEKKMFEVIDLNGDLLGFEKESVETNFCYGYGQNGLSSEEESRGAWGMANKVQNEYDVFVTENLKGLKQIRHNVLNGGAIIVGDKACRLLSWSWQGGEEKEMRNWNNARVLTAEEKQRVADVLSKQIENLEKRCKSYWKRYGGSKLKTWAYLVD